MRFDRADRAEEVRELRHGRYLTFAVGEEAYGLEIGCVSEVLGMQPIKKMLKTPRYVKGVMRFRGGFVPAMDLRIRLGKEPAAYTDRTCIVAAELGRTACGFIVDNVEDILNIPDNSISPPPDNIVGMRNRFLKGVGKAGGRVILLLDAQCIMAADEMGPVYEKTGGKAKKE